MDIRREGNVVALCCGRKRCPELTKAKKGNYYDLKDDFGGAVRLTKEQLLLIGRAVKELDD